MKLYYVERRFYDGVGITPDGTRKSYFDSVLDDEYFNTEGEAATKLVNNLYRLRENEFFKICEQED